MTLKTRLKRLTDCVKSNCNNSYYYDNPQIVRDDGKLQKVLATSFMQNSGIDCTILPPPPSPCDDLKEKNTSTWTSGIGGSIPDGVRDR